MRLHRFAIISGLGWLIDLSVMTLLVAAGVSIFVANLISAGIAITFVFFAAQNRIFAGIGGFLYAKFAIYLFYQALAVPLASGLIHELAHFFLSAGLGDLYPVSLLALPIRTALVSIVAKVIVTPLTLYSNFVFMGWLVERRISLL